MLSDLQKKECRQVMKKLLIEQEYEQRMMKSVEIRNSLIEQKEWREVKVIGITISRAYEVDTITIIEEAWKQGKKIVIPKCNPEHREMVFREITSFTQMEKGYSGLFEPIEGVTGLFSVEKIDLMVLPGLAFTRRGDRLGYGGGYFDRYLSTFSKKTIALGFEFQLLSQIPVTFHDKTVNKIITEKNVYFIS